MTADKKTPIPDERIDAELRRQLKDIQDEEMPERLLDLARTLQALLRQRDNPE